MTQRMRRPLQATGLILGIAFLATGLMSARLVFLRAWVPTDGCRI